MTNPYGTPDLDGLLIHEDFLRRIARSILSDGDLAEDAVQETWLRAVRSPPQEAAKSRAWLAVVTANVSKSFRRRAAVRRQVGAALEASAVDASLEPAAIVERELVRKRVVDAVLTLDPKARDAVLLMYFEGLTPKLGAQRLGIPVNTFLSRVHRARSELRTRLLDDADDRERTTRVLGTLAAWGSRAQLATRHTLRLLAIAAIPIVLIATVVILRPWREPPMPPTAPLVAKASDPEPARIPSPAPVAAAVAPERATAEKTYDLRGVVHDASGLLLAGANVTARTSKGLVETTTQKDGRFVLALAEPETVELAIESPQHLALRCLAHPSEELALVLRRGVPLRGFVRDAVSGRTVADAQISIEMRPGMPPPISATSDASGGFAFLAPAQPLDLSIRKNGYDSLRRVPFVPRTDGIEVFDLQPMKPDARAFVRVLDLAGRPIDAIETQFGTPRTLGGGVFEIELLTRRPISAQAATPGAPPGINPFAPSNAPTTHHVVLWRVGGAPVEVTLGEKDGAEASAPFEIRLPGRAVITGRVQDDVGKSVANALVVAIREGSRQGAIAPSGNSRVEVTTDDGGNFRLGELMEGAAYRVAATSELGTARLSSSVTATDEPSAIEIELDPGATIRGVIVDAAGQPVRGARLSVRATLQQKNARSGATGAASGKSAFEIDHELPTQRIGSSDADGRFEIAHVPNDARIEVFAVGHAALRELDLATVRDQALAGSLRLELAPEHVLIGKVVSRSGLPLPGARVTAQRASSSDNGLDVTVFSTTSSGAESTQFDGRMTMGGSSHAGAFETTSRIDGSFEIRGLTAGKYQLNAELGASTIEDPFLVAEADPRGRPKPHVLKIVRRCTLYGRAIDSATGRTLTDYSKSQTGERRAGIELSMGLGSDLFQQTLLEGEPIDSTVTTRAGDSLTARGLDTSHGEILGVDFELPDSRQRATPGGTVQLDAALPGAPGVRVTLSPSGANGTPLRVGLVGATSLHATLTALPAGKYRIALQDAKDTQFYCDPEVVEIREGATATITLKVR